MFHDPKDVTTGLCWKFMANHYNTQIFPEIHAHINKNLDIENLLCCSMCYVQKEFMVICFYKFMIYDIHCQLPDRITCIQRDVNFLIHINVGL